MQSLGQHNVTDEEIRKMIAAVSVKEYQAQITSSDPG